MNPMNPLLPATEQKTFQIFKSGVHRAMSGHISKYTEEDLKDIADSYLPGVSVAPLVIGHPTQVDAPSFGAVRSLFVDGGDLYAVADVSREMVDMVRNKNFVTVSASLYTPSAPNNPRPGRFYLKHVGFLGAAPPAVKGMKPLEFAGGEENPLIAEAEARAVFFAAPTSFVHENPLIADADQRRLKAVHRECGLGSPFCISD